MAIPSELYFRGTREAAAGRLGLAPIAALGASAVLLHAAGLFIFGRLLDSSASVSSRRRGAAGAGWGRRIPGLSPGASAVALAQVRLALRTPRGRSILLSPLIVFVIFAVMMRRGQGGFDFGLIALESGLGLATFGAVVSLIAVLPIAMNQFAIDGAGFTLALLTPLDDWDLLRGKAAGNALVAFAPALVCILGAALVFPGGHAALWACIPLGLLATYLLVAPAAAAFSTLFPRAVDLNSIGRGSNAHGAAGFLGLFAFLAGGAPPALLALLATRVLDRPALAPVLLAAWCLVCALLARLLFLPVKTLFASRRENLGMVHPGS